MKLEHSTLRTVYSTVELTLAVILTFAVACNYYDYYSNWEIAVSDFCTFWDSRWINKLVHFESICSPQLGTQHVGHLFLCVWGGIGHLFLYIFFSFFFGRVGSQLLGILAKCWQNNRLPVSRRKWQKLKIWNYTSLWNTKHYYETRNWADS